MCKAFHSAMRGEADHEKATSHAPNRERGSGQTSLQTGMKQALLQIKKHTRFEFVFEFITKMVQRQPATRARISINNRIWPHGYNATQRLWYSEETCCIVWEASLRWK